MATNSMKTDIKALLGLTRIQLTQSIDDYTSYLLSCKGYVSLVRSNLKYNVSPYEDQEKDIKFLTDSLKNIGEIFKKHNRGIRGGESWKNDVNIIDDILAEVDLITTKNEMCNYAIKADGTI